MTCRDKSLVGLRKLVTDFEPTVAMRIFKMMAQDMIIGYHHCYYYDHYDHYQITYTQSLILMLCSLTWSVLL
jgi:hypothetical protein